MESTFRWSGSDKNRLIIGAARRKAEACLITTIILMAPFLTFFVCVMRLAAQWLNSHVKLEWKSWETVKRKIELTNWFGENRILLFIKSSESPSWKIVIFQLWTVFGRCFQNIKYRKKKIRNFFSNSILKHQYYTRTYLLFRFQSLETFCKVPT